MVKLNLGWLDANHERLELNNRDEIFKVGSEFVGIGVKMPPKINYNEKSLARLREGLV
jgi:hypothetical protein